MTGRAGAPRWPLALVLGLVLNLALILAACAPRLQTPGPGPVIPYFDGDRMVMADGDRRPFRQWSPAGDGRPRAVVIALHGFGDHGQAFETVGAALATRGIAVIAPDQRGFGRSRARGIWPGGRALVADLAVIARLVAARYPGRPIFVLGESMGGAVAMVARAEGLPVAGVILVAPAVWGRASMPRWQVGALDFFVRLVPWLPLDPSATGKRASDNLAMLRALGRDPLFIRHPRLDTVWGLVNLMDAAAAAADGLDPPLLLLLGARDEIVPRPPICQMLVDLPRRPGIVRRLYPDGHHMLLRDLAGARVIADIAAWISGAALPPLPAPATTGFCAGVRGR